MWFFLIRVLFTPKKQGPADPRATSGSRMDHVRLQGPGRDPANVANAGHVRPAPGDNGALSPAPRGSEPVPKVLGEVNL